MAKKFYVVWEGRKTGIFTDWDTCKKQVYGFPGAKYKSFSTRAEAEIAFAKAPAGGGKKKAAKKKGTSRGSLSNKDVQALLVDVKIFTDGGCEPNPGQAGSGISIYRDNRVEELWYGLYDLCGTNNTAELNALYQALILARGELEAGDTVAILCDSKYSIQCITEWAAGWEKRGWKRPSGEIKNLELIKEIYSLYLTLAGKIEILHVNGHVGIEGNELADRMSILAVDTKEETFRKYDKPMNLMQILAMRQG